jgi:hypothetical protein
MYAACAALWRVIATATADGFSCLGLVVIWLLLEVRDGQTLQRSTVPFFVSPFAGPRSRCRKSRRSSCRAGLQRKGRVPRLSPAAVRARGAPSRSREPPPPRPQAGPAPARRVLPIECDGRDRLF